MAKNTENHCPIKPTTSELLAWTGLSLLIPMTPNLYLFHYSILLRKNIDHKHYIQVHGTRSIKFNGSGYTDHGSHAHLHGLHWDPLVFHIKIFVLEFFCCCLFASSLTPKDKNFKKRDYNPFSKFEKKKKTPHNDELSWLIRQHMSWLMQDYKLALSCCYGSR